MLPGAPQEWKVVGEFKGSDGEWYLDGGHFRDYIRRLKKISFMHGLEREFMRNGGIFSPQYSYSDVPRALVRDADTSLEFLVETYDERSPGYGNAYIAVYSINTERAKQIVYQEFSQAEFGEQTLPSGMMISARLPGHDVRLSLN